MSKRTRPRSQRNCKGECEFPPLHRGIIPHHHGAQSDRFGTKRTTETDRFSNRPSGVKRFQAIHQLQCRCRSRARASLRTRHQGPSIMGFEDEVEQSFGRPCRRCNGRLKRTNELTSSIVPRGTSFHRWVELDFAPISCQAAATSLLHRNSVPSTHMRCMITANRRASATIAFFIPRCLAIFIAQALSQDHFVERTSMLWAAS
jgi:hypothetical protein